MQYSSSRRGEDDLGVRVLLVLELIDLDLDVLLEKVAVAKWQRQATRQQVASRHDVGDQSLCLQQRMEKV